MAKKIITENRTSLNREELATLAKVSNDVFYFSLFTYVIHPMRGKVKFELYPYQKSVLYNFVKERFNILLKFRQAGITELISMYCLWLAMYHPNKKINIISIKDTTAKKVLKKIKFMYKNLPWYLQTPIINGRAGEYGSASMIEFDNGSFIESIPTSSEAGRSESLSLLVIDEAAVVRWAAQIWAAAFPTLSTGGAAIINSCVTGDTKLICRNGLIPIKDLCPESFGKKDIRNLGIQVLSHTGKWRNIIGSLNKGLLETWEIENDRGRILKCTPQHKLYTIRGWMSVKNILEKGIEAIFYDTGVNDLLENPITEPPKKEIFKKIPEFPNYLVSNLGRVCSIRNGIREFKKLRSCSGREEYLNVTLWDKGIKKKICIHNLVAKIFIGEVPEGYIVDHIDNNPSHNYVTNLQIITLKENTQKAAKHSYNMTIASKVKGGFKYDLRVAAYIKRYFSKHSVIRGNRWSDIKGTYDKLIYRIYKKFGVRVSKQYIQGICWGTKSTKTYISKLKLNRVYMDTIYDICVEEDESYLTNTEYVSHNTPYGVGNFYHSTWVDAIAGGNPFNPLRLYWQMHPERDINWYNEMSSALGTKRTAQEIDGDFLSSGNTVFDLSDIKAIEDCLSDYPVLKKRFNGQYRQFCEPEDNKEYFIGADVSTGRATDYSAFTCMDKAGEEQAVFKGRLSVDKYARLLGDTGQLFNFATLAPESNDVGLAVTSKLQDEGYPKLYYYQKMLKKKGKSRPEMDKSPGWLTTQKNRSVIVEGLEQDIREDNITCKDPFFVQEAYTFIYDGLGRPVAMGKHRANNSTVDVDLEGDVYSDDSIFGKAICNHIRKGKTNVIVQPK
jgi:hypothetical protein